MADIRLARLGIHGDDRTALTRIATAVYKQLEQ